MNFPLGFWDINIWLAVTAIILLITSELISPYYGKTNLLINKKKTTKRSTNCLNTLPHNSSNKNSHHHNHPMKHKDSPTYNLHSIQQQTSRHAWILSRHRILQPHVPPMETLSLATQKQKTHPKKRPPTANKHYEKDSWFCSNAP